MPLPLPTFHTGSWKLHLFGTTVFHNTSSVDMSAWATLEDIVFVKLQKYTWNILYLRPWVYPSLPAAEWENLQNLFRAYLQDVVLYLSNDARLYQAPCEYQVLSTSSPKAVRKSSEPPPTAFPNWGWQAGREWASSCTSKTPKPPCPVRRSHGSMLVPSTKLGCVQLHLCPHTSPRYCSPGTPNPTREVI